MASDQTETFDQRMQSQREESASQCKELVWRLRKGKSCLLKFGDADFDKEIEFDIYAIHHLKFNAICPIYIHLIVLCGTEQISRACK